MANEKWAPSITYRDILMPNQARPKKICSVYPDEVILPPYIGYGTLIMPAKPEDAPYAFVEVGPGEEKKDLGNNEFLVLKSIPSHDIALDIIGLRREKVDALTGHRIEAITNSTLWRMGMFVPEEDDPSPAEIAAANKRLRKYFEDQILEGDAQFAQTNNARLVPTAAKLAARYLNVTKPWSSDIKNFDKSAEEGRMQCPACMDQIAKGAKRCKHCGASIGYSAKTNEPYWIDEPRQVAAGSKL